MVRLQNIGHAEFRDGDAAYISAEHYATLGDHDVKVNDLLVAGLGDDRHPAGRACVAPAFIVPAMVKADCFRFRLRLDRLNPEFAALQLTATAVAASAILSTGATRQRTNLLATAARTIAIPPLREQHLMVKEVEEMTRSIKHGAGLAQSEIDLLREFRTRLIADVVTGKLDVRDAAARLPDVIEAPESLEEAVSDAEDSEDNETDAAPEEAEA